MVSYAVAGYGYWGPNIVRNLHAVPDAQVKWVCDLDTGRLQRAKKLFPSVNVTSDFSEVLGDSSVDAIVLCTPAGTHSQLAIAALNAGKHVFVEKPLARTSFECRELITLAAARDLRLGVGHTFVYAGAVRKMKELLTAGTVGDLVYIDSVRTNLGPAYRSDVNAVWDLATHDLSIIDYFLDGCLPEAVSVVGKAVLGDVEDFAYLTLWYPNNLLAHIHVNWFAPVKLRQMLIAGRKTMLVYDDNEASEKVRVYDKGGEMHSRDDEFKRRVEFRSGDVHLPKLDGVEPLFSELSDFTNSIVNRTPTVSDAASGLRIVRILEAASRSLRENGRVVQIEPEPALA